MMTRMATDATVVLVHGAWHGAWCWRKVVPALDDARVANVSIENPSVADAPASLSDDIDRVRLALDAIDRPVVLVGHSYGGAVVTGAGTHDTVRHVVYLSAFALDEGESVMQNDLKGGEGTKLGDALAFDGDLIRFDPQRAIEFFYHDCTSADAQSAVDELKPMSAAAMAEPLGAVAWRAKPSTYVVCTDDRALPVRLQRSNAARVDDVREMPTSHSPFISRPDLVSELLIELARSSRA